MTSQIHLVPGGLSDWLQGFLAILPPLTLIPLGKTKQKKLVCLWLTSSIPAQSFLSLFLDNPCFTHPLSSLSPSPNPTNKKINCTGSTRVSYFKALTMSQQYLILFWTERTIISLPPMYHRLFTKSGHSPPRCYTLRLRFLHALRQTILKN
jgi:hypothetical protein